MEDKKKTAPQERGAAKRQRSMRARVIQVIAVETALGSGTEQDPNRIAKEYWSMEGELLAVHDPEVNPFGPRPSHH